MKFMLSHWLILLLCSLALLPVASAQIIPGCRVFGPLPTGVNDDPLDMFTQSEHHRAHSSVHLQGQPAYEKWAAGYFLPSDGDFIGWRTLVVVNNPWPNQSLNVDIIYRDQQGNIMATSSPPTIQPEGYWAELPPSQTTGIGVIQVRSRQADIDPPFVGATIHHTYEYNGEQENHGWRNGATSMQQLQMMQNSKTVLWWGPIWMDSINQNGTDFDFFSGLTALFHVINPTSQVNNVTVLIFDTNGALLANYGTTIQPFGSLMDTNLWLYNWYLNFQLQINQDFMVYVQSDDGLPLVGEGLMADFFGPDPANITNLMPHDRFRMGSTMMANTPSNYIVNPEVVVEPASIFNGNTDTWTYMGVFNASAVDIGPVTIEYRDRNGAYSQDTIASFPGFQTLRIGPGLPQVPNYPSQEFAGTITIQACQSALVGWSMRANEHPDPVQQVRFRKVWGESVHYNNGLEPGNGIYVTVNPNYGPPRNLTRKVAPLDLVSFAPLSSYTTFYNDSATNVGDYYYRFFLDTGTDVTDYSFQPFAGTQWGSSSFAYEDPTGPRPVVQRFYSLPSGTVEVTSGNVKGIDVLGGWLAGWPFPELEFPRPTGGTYYGPCDVVGYTPWWCL